MPRVSVIIVTYNQASTIARAIESVLGQKGEVTYEIVIGDDGSTDGTRQVCERFAREHLDMITLLPEAPNKGVVDNYFDCLEQCRGEFVTDCAGDDYWTDPLKIDRLTAQLDSHPEATVAFSDWNILDSNSGRMRRASDMPAVLRPDGTVYGSAELLKRVLNHVDTLPYNLTASLYRRRVVMEGLATAPAMVRNREFGCEDLPIMSLLASRGGAVGCPEATYTYVENDGSIVGGSDSRKLVNFYSRSLRCTAALADHYGVERSELMEMFRAKAAYIVGLAFESRDPELMRMAIEAVAQWPLTPRLTTRIKMWWCKKVGKTGKDL
ncbi:MAG: glycosyltransferase [Muribaculaceae bacterium]|nr:glycosyltransferase [Muribaculaceae bacterium]